MIKRWIRLVLHRYYLSLYIKRYAIYKGRPISFLPMNLHIISTNSLVLRPFCLTFLQLGGWIARWQPFWMAWCFWTGQTDINKKVPSGADCQTVTKYNARFLPNFNEHFVEFMQQSDHWFPIHLRWPGPQGLGFQHLPRNLANINAWKTMFDLYFEQLWR